ncbi:Protein SEED AND ROOT HAIR PROTECTIVE PROTEIN [Linum grandiflorum]
MCAGAVARITCLAEDEQGYETAPFSVSSTPSDAKGYYFTTLYLSQLSNAVNYHIKLKECKAFLESSPEGCKCKYPTDANGGVNGAPLTSYRVLDEKQMKLYTIKPLVFSTSSADDPELAPADAPFSPDGY